MESLKIEKLRESVLAMCGEPSSWPDQTKLISEVLRSEFESADSSSLICFEQMLNVVRLAKGIGVDAYANTLKALAMQALGEGKNMYAVFLYRKAMAFSTDRTGNNDIAYVLRKYAPADFLTSKEIMMLLIPGAKEREPYCMVNLALFFAVSISPYKDWQIADRLFADMRVDDASNVLTWWDGLAHIHDPEGYLVNLWLLRHGKISKSELGSFSELAAHVRVGYPDAPEWLFCEAVTSNRLEDYILSHLRDNDFEQGIRVFLGNMTVTPETANEVLHVADVYPYFELYRALLTTFASFLSGEQREKILRRCQERFPDRTIIELVD